MHSTRFSIASLSLEGRRKPEMIWLSLNLVSENVCLDIPRN